MGKRGGDFAGEPQAAGDEARESEAEGAGGGGSVPARLRIQAEGVRRHLARERGGNSSLADSSEGNGGREREVSHFVRQHEDRLRQATLRCVWVSCVLS